MSTTKCKKCGGQITEITARDNDGLCMPCVRGAIICAVCGRRTFAVTRGLFTDGLCLQCFAARENEKPTQIDRFIKRRANGECSLLRSLFHLEQNLRRNDAHGFIGLILIDPPVHYKKRGTILYDSRRSPTNSVAFATTGGDDVHFSIVRHNGILGDDSPVVMTVPMGDEDVLALNIILGKNLHEFLCLGCEHGYACLEELFYDRDNAIAYLNSDPSDDDLEGGDKSTLERYRQELGLARWSNIGNRLQSLEREYKSALRFKNPWFPWSA